MLALVDVEGVLVVLISAPDGDEPTGSSSGVSEVKLADGADGNAALTLVSWRAHSTALSHVLSSANGDKPLTASRLAT